MKQPDLRAKLAKLPKGPGVYLHKDAAGKIIYVGKAARLNNRVRQYFQKSRLRDTKTDLLVKDIASVDWLETESEIDALFLEAELIKRYKPKYNVELRDDKSDLYVRIDLKSHHPTVGYTRRPLDDGADYIGPFPFSGDLKRAMRLLRRVFPYDMRTPASKQRVTLDYHLGLSPGLEEAKTSLDEYRQNLRKLRLYLTGKRSQLIKTIEKEMKAASESQDFERAARLRDQARALKSLRTQIVFGDREFIDLSKDQALNELAKLLHLPGPPKRIEGYDISHLHGQNNVASMVVFSSGLPDKSQYRKFKMHTLGNDDFAHIHEVILRRFSPRNLARWPKPDLLLIDGGKGQLSAALSALKELGANLPTIALAKRRETVIVFEAGEFKSIELSSDSHVRKLLTRIRDESHRFAISYQSTLSRREQVRSPLEDIPGIGPATRKQLVQYFGSVRAALDASPEELTRAIGPKRAGLINKHKNVPPEAPRNGTITGQ